MLCFYLKIHLNGFVGRADGGTYSALSESLAGLSEENEALS